MTAWLKSIRPNTIPLVQFLIFAVIAALFGLLDGPMLLVNFLFIGAMIATGMWMMNRAPKKKKQNGRFFTLFMVGIFWMLIFAGLLGRENMQLEGFWFVLFAGSFSSAVVHYTVAKILGPVIFGRSWCGWTCWTVTVLDFLPFKRSKARLPGKWERLRYAHFVLSFLIVAFLWFGVQYRPGFNTENVMLWYFTGNVLYYIVGVALAFLLKDNRAFCKYACPVPVFQKLGTRYSLLKIDSDAKTCSSCGACNKVCPMNIDVMYYAQKGLRVASSECIQCQTCVHVCVPQSLNLSFGLDKGDGQDHLIVANSLRVI
jgi:polyferredoxin